MSYEITTEKINSLEMIKIVYEIQVLMSLQLNQTNSLLNSVFLFAVPMMPIFSFGASYIFCLGPGWTDENFLKLEFDLLRFECTEDFFRSPFTDCFLLLT